VPTTLIQQQDGVRLTVNMMRKSPTLVPKRILAMMDNEFLVDDVLRTGDSIPSGALIYFESTPLFANDNPKIMDEFGEIPTTYGSVGLPKVARSVRRALGLRISKQMVDRNNVDAVNIQITQVKNTMVRAWEDALFSAFVANGMVQIIATDTAWGLSTSHIRRDINAARYLIKNAAADTAGLQKFGYIADTLIISTATEEDFLNSTEVSTPYVGNIASENLLYVGTLPNKFLTLDVMVSWRLSIYAPSCAVVLQRKVCGGISDERPLSSTPMYGEGNGPNGGPTESWRTDTTRASAIFVDQPQSVCFIAGVNGGSSTFDGVAYSSGTDPTILVPARL
jgi:hypothetical protein